MKWAWQGVFWRHYKKKKKREDKGGLLSQKTPLTGFRYTGYSMKQAARACITFSLFFSFWESGLEELYWKGNETPPSPGVPLGCHTLGKSWPIVNGEVKKDIEFEKKWRGLVELEKSLKLVFSWWCVLRVFIPFSRWLHWRWGLAGWQTCEEVRFCEMPAMRDIFPRQNCYRCT